MTPLDALLCGDFDPGEEDTWRAALTAAAPGWRWLTPAQARAQPETVIAAVVANPPPGSLQGLPALRLVQSLWAGVDRLLADRTLPPGVPVARMVDPLMSAAMAETALWAVLALQRGFFRYAQQQQQALWRPLPQRRADETRVTVLGLGAMGRTAAAAVARAGHVVHAWSRTPTDPALLPPGVEAHAGAAALQPLLAATDIAVNLLPLTADTRGLIDARFLAALPPQAALVNLARGAHVVEADLLAALDGGTLQHAVLDVFATEPLPAGHPFWHHPRVTVLPHAAAATDPRSAAAVVGANLQALIEGRPIAHLVDPARGY
jgi:glyoxylate/hydroxypyruvate reductase A